MVHHLTGEATDRPFFEGDQHFVMAGQLFNQGGVDRLGESGVGDGGGKAAGGQLVGRLHRVGQTGAKREDGDAVPLAQEPALAELKNFPACRQGHAGSLAARIAEGAWPVVDGGGGGDGVDKFGLI